MVNLVIFGRSLSARWVFLRFLVFLYALTRVFLPLRAFLHAEACLFTGRENMPLVGINILLPKAGKVKYILYPITG